MVSAWPCLCRSARAPPALGPHPDHRGESITVPTVDGDAEGDHRWADEHGVAVLLRLKNARGCGPDADAFSLAAHGMPQHLADGSALLTWSD